jgi:3-oxoacyl-[acyl-carrier-protein] synthase II
MGRCTQFVLSAGLEAWKDAGLPERAPDPERSGVLIGTGIGDGYETFDTAKRYLSRGVKGVHPLYVTRVMPNAAAGIISVELGLEGPTFATASACASSAHATALALRLIRAGDADLLVTGGAEEMFLTVVTLASFDALRAVSRRNDDPERASRPFDRDRDGFVLAEGAGVVILEELEHARRRGARIYAELTGAGMASDAHHATAPEPSGKGAVRAMSLAIQDSSWEPSDVQYINAHGTSTQLNDRIESLAIRRTLGPQADRVLVNSTKSMIGHTIGASAVLGLIATVLSLHEGRVHPTINLENPDPECDLDFVPHKGRSVDLRTALVNSFGFGGHCVSLAVGRPEETK